MKTFPVRLFPALLCLLAVAQTAAQTVEQVILFKGSSWLQTSASDPVIDPRNPGPRYGGPYNFLIEVGGTNISAIPAPVVTLAPGSLYPAQNPLRHNGGVLGYDAIGENWGYGIDANQWGGTTEAARDQSFAFGTYGMNVLGESFSLNFPTTAFPANTPKVIMTGGTWSGGKYLIDVTQPLTVTTNAFANFDRNIDGVMSLSVGDNVTDLLTFHSDHPGEPNFLTVTIPANTLAAGKDYPSGVSFYAVMDKRGSFATRLDATTYQRFTEFKISAIAPIQPGAQATLHGVGELNGGDYYSEVRDATKSGGVIFAVGDSNAYGVAPGGDTGFLWTSTNGLRPLPDIVTNFSDTNFSTIAAPAITPNATFIASRARAGSNGMQRHAVRVAGSGLGNLDLGTLPGFTFSQTSTISDDGSVLYGIANYTSAASVPVKNRAVRFTTSPATVTTIPFLNAGDDNSTPADRGASADGSVMVGRSTNGTVDASAASPGGNGLGVGNQAFRYVHGAGVSAIPFIAGGTWSGAVAVTPDGKLTLVRGNSASAPQGEFYLHNATSGVLTSLGTPNGSRRPGGIVGMTADGSVVAAPFNAADNPTNATYIHNAHGWHDFQTLLERAGVDLSGWDLRSQTIFGISPDGTLVWGRGLHGGNPEGWVAEFAPGYLAAAAEPAVYSTPGTAIVGAWAVDDPTRPGGVRGVVIFCRNGYYMHIELNEVGNDSDADGFERGQYTWDASTGAFTCTTLLDTNGDIGLSGGNGATISIAGNIMTVTSPTSGEVFSLTRVSGASPIVGAWGDASKSDDSVALVFLPNGYYFMAQDGDSTPAGDPNGHDGMEWGTYSWNSATGGLSTQTLVDTNGQWGLSHPQGPQTVTVSGDLRILTGSDASGSSSRPRIGVASATVSLGNLAQVYDGSPKSATATTAPAGLSTSILYDGSSVPPTAVGSYFVGATITHPDYQGSATGTLVIAPAPVQNDTPPVFISLYPSPNSLGLPNGRMVPVTIMANVSDDFDPAPVTTIVSVASNQAITPGVDWQITGPLTLKLRASTSSPSAARFYLITVETHDHSGHSTTGTVTVFAAPLPSRPR